MSGLTLLDIQAAPKGGTARYHLLASNQSIHSAVWSNRDARLAKNKDEIAMPRLLIADDDVELCAILRNYFDLDGMQLDAVHLGDTVLDALAFGNYDLLILDIMLPGMMGLDVLREIRRNGTIPILMLSARGEEMDRVLGLELGADDYLPKPCSPRELVARVRSILRRANITEVDSTSAKSANSKLLRVGDLDLNLGARQVQCAGVSIDLTGTEFNVLHELLKCPGELIKKGDLCQRALGRRLEPFDRSLDTHVSNLRKKLGPTCDGRPRISSLRGAGYIYVVAVES
jgi:two-component system response regulator CpxR